MTIRSLSFVLSAVCVFNCASVFADQTKQCSAEQTANCQRFCTPHNGVQSCVIDITKEMGACTCVDGTTHTKSK